MTIPVSEVNYEIDLKSTLGRRIYQSGAFFCKGNEIFKTLENGKIFFSFKKRFKIFNLLIPVYLSCIKLNHKHVLFLKNIFFFLISNRNFNNTNCIGFITKWNYFYHNNAALFSVLTKWNNHVTITRLDDMTLLNQSRISVIAQGVFRTWLKHTYNY